MDRKSSGPETTAQWVRAVGNVVNLSTPAGLLVCAVGRARVRRGPRGLLLAEGYQPRFPLAGAFTVGNVVVCRSSWELLSRRFPQLLDHEERHTWQYLYCLGLPYYLAYTACMAWSVLRTGDRASANFFERQAGLVAGGYQERDTRPITVAVSAQMSMLRSMPRRFAERLR
ncbi:MAG TPA: hypothetical protein VFP89_02790 [Propionibacteriaceae bacterium]|nr:hypothetical protein [Propionibacteriaceae bacterium]